MNLQNEELSVLCNQIADNRYLFDGASDAYTMLVLTLPLVPSVTVSNFAGARVGVRNRFYRRYYYSGYAIEALRVLSIKLHHIAPKSEQ